MSVYIYIYKYAYMCVLIHRHFLAHVANLKDFV